MKQRGTCVWVGLLLTGFLRSGGTMELPGEGTSWIFFPDGDGNPQRVYLNSTGQTTRLNYEKHISFQLYTKQNPESGETIHVDNVRLLKSSKFNPEHRTKFIVHGWRSHGRSKAMLRIKSAYLKTGEANVIVVDWNQLSSSIYYNGPVANTSPVGNYIGKMIQFLVKEGKTTLDEIHVVGHSLGAHVAGFAGASLAPKKLARITGLDPASPGFANTADDFHLDKTDATFVDIIHTCGGILGYSAPLGHVDFYPNGGTSAQPGCCCLPMVSQACSHSRAHELFAESITSLRGFAAQKCFSWKQFQNGACVKQPQRAVFMGDSASGSKSIMDANGVYYLHTRDTAPFALG